MKVLITGGHFSPAYSIISELKKRGHSVVIAGRKHPFEGDKTLSFEYLVSQNEKLSFYEIKAGRFQRKFTHYSIFSLLKTPLGFFTALDILRKTRPDVVMTFGGYIGLPISYAAAFLRIPVVLHEQTQQSGLASRLISSVASKICISFRSSAEYFPKSKTIFTGNPIRPEVFNIDKKNGIYMAPNQGKKVIYITGGSTGSHFINLLIYKIATELLKDYILIHQTGEASNFNDYEKLESLRESLPTNKKNGYILRKFIYPKEIGAVISKSDMFLSRAGANTLFETFATKKMSLFIPLPNGQNNEQLLNARLAASVGISEYINESDAAPEIVISKIKYMFDNESKYQSNMEKAKEYVVMVAGEVIVDVIEKAAK